MSSPLDMSQIHTVEDFKKWMENEHKFHQSLKDFRAYMLEDLRSRRLDGDWDKVPISSILRHVQALLRQVNAKMVREEEPEFIFQDCAKIATMLMSLSENYQRQKEGNRS